MNIYSSALTSVVRSYAYHLNTCADCCYHWLCEDMWRALDVLTYRRHMTPETVAGSCHHTLCGIEDFFHVDRLSWHLFGEKNENFDMSWLFCLPFIYSFVYHYGGLFCIPLTVFVNRRNHWNMQDMQSCIKGAMKANRWLSFIISYYHCDRTKKKNEWRKETMEWRRGSDHMP